MTTAEGRPNSVLPPIAPPPRILLPNSEQPKRVQGRTISPEDWFRFDPIGEETKGLMEFAVMGWNNDEFGVLNRNIRNEVNHRLDGLAIGIDNPSSAGRPLRLTLATGKSLTVYPKFVVNDLFSVRELAADGLGIAPLPSFMVQGDLNRGRLVRVSRELVSPIVPSTAIHSGPRFQPSRVRLLIQFLISKFRGADWSRVTRGF